MQEPKKLLKGDLITLIAPSFGCTTEPYLTRLEAAIKMLRKAGYRVEEGPNVHLAEGISASASGKLRAEEFMDAYLGEGSLILSVGGGELMCEMLPYVDFEAIKKAEPKWFMGFSDNTNLTFLLTTLSGVKTIYGPCAPQFFMKKWRLSELDAMEMLQGRRHFEGYPKWSITRRNEEHPLYAYRLSQPKIITPHNYAPMRGMFLGGCIDCLVNLCGTRFDNVQDFVSKQEEGIIWYLEACELNALSLRRAYLQMKEAGWFKNVKGFLLGRMLSAREERLGATRFNAAIDILGDLGVPILMDVDLGHLSPSMPFLNGATGTAKLENGNIIIDYD